MAAPALKYPKEVEGVGGFEVTFQSEGIPTKFYVIFLRQFFANFWDIGSPSRRTNLKMLRADFDYLVQELRIWGNCNPSAKLLNLINKAAH